MDPSAILLVDDDDDLLESLAGQLRRAAFEVVTASSVPQAIALLGERRFDVIVTDYDLHTRENGGHLLEHAAERFPAIGRVVCSGSTVPSDVEAHALVEKPASLSMLLRVLDALTGRRRSARG